MTAPAFFDVVVKQLSSQLFHGGHLLSASPTTVKAILGENEWGRPMWPDRVDNDTGEIIRFESFEDFVTTPPTDGLGTTVEMLFDVCRRDPEAIDMLDRAVQRGRGRPPDIVRNPDNTPRPRSETQQDTIRALRKHAPELHGKVLAGEMTVAQAAKAAGIRRRRVAISLSNPHSAAMTITKKASPEFISELVNLLNHERKGT